MQEENNAKPSWQEKMGKDSKNNEKTQENEENLQENGENSPENEENLTNEQVLEQKLAKTEKALIEVNDKLLRTLAEIENVRRRSKEEIAKTSNYAISNFVADLVVVAENFFLACDNAPKEKMDSDNEVKNFAIGVEMTKKELMKTLEKNKVKRIFPLGEQFNHNFHEAIAQVESDKDSGEVVQVVQAGYSMGDRLIRPALVQVSKG